MFCILFWPLIFSRCFTRNTRVRRGMKPDINIPSTSLRAVLFIKLFHSWFFSVYKDKNTLRPFVEDFSAVDEFGYARNFAKPDHIYLDAMGFGNGCCCLQVSYKYIAFSLMSFFYYHRRHSHFFTQVTFQACNLEEARHLYDQLATLCPLMVRGILLFITHQ